jgi:hypothetical protein
VHRVQYVPARVCRGATVGVGAVREHLRARKHVECGMKQCGVMAVWRDGCVASRPESLGT